MHLDELQKMVFLALPCHLLIRLEVEFPTNCSSTSRGSQETGLQASVHLPLAEPREQVKDHYGARVWLIE